MEIKRLFIALNYPNRMVLEALDGRFYSFNITPSRYLTETDLEPLPGWIPKGWQAEEAPDYMLSFYGLEHVESPFIAVVESDRSYPRKYHVETSGAVRLALDLGKNEPGETVTVYENGKPMARAVWSGSGYSEVMEG